MIKYANLKQLKRGELPLSEYQDIINARMRGVISTFKDSSGVPADVQLIIDSALGFGEDPCFNGSASDFKNLPEYHDYYSSRVLAKVLPVKGENCQPLLLIYYI